MTRTTLLGICLLLVFASLGGAASADMESLTFTAVLDGVTAPLTVRLGDLTPQWRVFTLKSGLEGLAHQGIVVHLASQGIKVPQPQLFTRGDTLVYGNEVFLLAYQEPMPVLDARAIAQGTLPTPVYLTEETPLSLTLLNQRLVGSLNDIRPFNLREILAAEKALKTACEAVVGGKARTQSLTALGNLNTRLLRWAEVNTFTLPKMLDLPALKKLLAAPETAWLQPGTKLHYGINMILTEHRLAQIARPDMMVVFFETMPDANGGRCIALLNGDVAYITAAQWETYKKWSKITEVTVKPNPTTVITFPTPLTPVAPLIPGD